MNRDAVLSGDAGLAGIQWALQGKSARQDLRGEIYQMLLPGWQFGPLHLTRAKFKPRKTLSAFYTLTISNASSGARRMLPLAVTWKAPGVVVSKEDEFCAMQDEADRRGLLSPFHQLWRDIPEPGIRLQAWPLDPDFPQLVRLGDPHYTWQFLQSTGIRPSFEPNGNVTVIPIRYRPGERHVLRFDLCPPGMPPGQILKLYAKLYKNPTAAARTYRVANRVVDWLAANPQAAQGVRPAGWNQADSVILYPHASGIPLSKQLHRSRAWLLAQLRTVGMTLRALHSGPVSLVGELEENTLEQEITVIRRASEHVRVLLPEIEPDLLRLLERAQELYQRLPQEPSTFTHSDFKCDHLLAHPNGLTLIDFDTCALADPALDLGKFLADLEWWFALTRTPAVEQAQEAFLQGYQQGEPSDRMLRARVYQALILMKIVIRRARLFSKDWAALTLRMIRRAEGIMQQVETERASTR